MNPWSPTPPYVRGDLAPWFRAQSLGGRSDWTFASAAGAPILLLLAGSAGHPRVAQALDVLLAERGLFDDVTARFFGVSVDPLDVAQYRIAERLPGVRWFVDHDRAVSRLYGATADGDGYRPHILLLDAALHVAGRFTLDEASAALAALKDLRAAPLAQDWAPVLTVPNLFEPKLCRDLIALYDADGGAESGFMREVDGKTTVVADPAFKRRRDAQIEAPALRSAINARIVRRLVPAIRKAFQFEATRIERYIVAAYDADGGGYFHAHRDNTTKGTAHRRFAVTINLNDDYVGGDLRFPEFGSRIYRAPKGGAVVFSCSLLHEATPMVSGRRYACLPFLYDEAAAAVRSANNAFLDASIQPYAA